MKKISSKEFIDYILSWGFVQESYHGTERYIKRKNNNFIYAIINRDDSILVSCNNSDWTFEAGHQYDALKYIAHNDRFLSSGNFDTDGDKYVTDEESSQEKQKDSSGTNKPTINTSTLQKFITLTKRLNKQLFFKDSNGNLKRVAMSKYDSIKPEQLANVFVTKTGKEEMSLASIIPQLKQDNLIEQIEKLYEGDINMNNLVEDREESIYEQLNNIDDNKSLDEKWNVKNQCELKKLKESLYDEDEDDYEDDYDNYEDDELEQWNWDGLKDDIDTNIWDVRLDNKKPFEYYTEVIDDEYIHIIIYIENGDNTVTRYEADLVDMYAVPEDSAGVVAYIEDLPWKQTGIEPIDDDENESLTEALAKEKAARSLGYAYTLKDIRSSAEKIAKETNKHEQRRKLKDLTSGCRVIIKEVDDLVKRLTTYSDALHTFVNSSRTDADAKTLADALKDLSI